MIDYLIAHWDLLLFLIGVGIAAGFCGGLMGIGGSVVIIPALIFKLGGDKQHLYQATSMMVNLFVVAPAVVRHMRAKAVDYRLLKGMVPGAIAGVVVGVWLSEFEIFRGPGQGRLQIGFAIFICYVFLQNAKRLIQGRPEKKVIEGDRRRSAAAGAGIVGLPAGALSGLLGIGGGLFMVPAQQSLLNIPMITSIANSASTILFSSIIGATFKASALDKHGADWGQAIIMSMMLAPTCMLGAWIGAARAHRWPVRVIRVAFGTLLAYSALRLFMIGFSQLQSAPPGH